MAFQIADDILDVEGTVDVVGKATGKDSASGKATFVSLLGLEGAKTRAQDLVNEACVALDDFGDRADILKRRHDLLCREIYEKAARVTQTPPHTPLLDRVTTPADLKIMSDRELRLLADDLRAETVSAVSETGGHLGAGLGRG